MSVEIGKTPDELFVFEEEDLGEAGDGGEGEEPFTVELGSITIQIEREDHEEIRIPEKYITPFFCLFFVLGTVFPSFFDVGMVLLITFSIFAVIQWGFFDE